MGKKYYVDGNIVILTPYFACPNMGAKYEIPQGADIIKTNDILDGRQCLIIDDNRPQSMFNEYYATGEVAGPSLSYKYLFANYEECYNIYDNAIGKIKETLKELLNLSESSRLLLYKSLYISSITALDGFLCSIILVKILQDEETFKRYYEKQIPQHIQKKLQKYLLNDERAKWEQQYIIEVLKGSYCNINLIKDVFKFFNWRSLQIDSLEHCFHCRHVLVHRNGMKRDGSYITIDSKTIEKLVDDLNLFVDSVMNMLRKQ